MKMKKETKPAKKPMKKMGDTTKKQCNPSMVIYAPVELSIGLIDGKKVRKVVKGALLPKKTIDDIVKLIDKANSNGLKGQDAILLMALKNASGNLGRK